MDQLRPESRFNVRSIISTIYAINKRRCVNKPCHRIQDSINWKKSQSTTQVVNNTIFWNTIYYTLRWRIPIWRHLVIIEKIPFLLSDSRADISNYNLGRIGRAVNISLCLIWLWIKNGTHIFGIAFHRIPIIISRRVQCILCNQDTV